MIATAVVLLAGCDSATRMNVPERDLPLSMRVLPVSASPERSCTIPGPLPPGGIPAVDTSVTPRSHAAAEVLAVEASGELVSAEALYRRVARELEAIFGSSESVPGEVFFGCGAISEVIVGMTDAGRQQVESGAYTAWDEYNQTLRLREMRQLGTGAFVLHFDGVYNLATLAHAYGQLPEVEYAERNGFVGGRGDLCLERFGDELDTHVYISWSGSGDCAAGCISSTYSGFVTDASGAVEFLGSFEGGDTEPDWFVKARQCRNFL